MPHIARIRLYPIVALDPVEVPCAAVAPTGRLEFDQRFALLDESGNIVTAATCRALLRVRAQYDLAVSTVTLCGLEDSAAETFHLVRDAERLAAWMSIRLGINVRLEEYRAADRTAAGSGNGPTLVTSGTLKEAAAWFPGLSAEEMRRRVRANLELGGALAFWEDRLFAQPGYAVRLAVGRVELTGLVPQECAASFAYDAQTGADTPVPVSLEDQKLSERRDVGRPRTPALAFQQHFMRMRRETLPSFVAQERFKHFYKLGVLTRLEASAADRTIRIGDRVRILDRRPEGE